MKYGLNLFSIRNCIQTADRFMDTAHALRSMGYDYMQFSGAPYDHEVIARVSRESGLPVVLTHVPYSRIVGDTDRLMAEHEHFGCRNIGLGAMTSEALRDPSVFDAQVAELDRAGKYMAERGFTLFYHHHHFEFARYRKTTYFAYLLEHAPHIHFTLDTYWLQYGGADVCDTITRLAGRAECLHLKDYKIVGEAGDFGSYHPLITSVGDGNLDFDRILDVARRSGTQYFLVEQDNAADAPDPLAEAAKSIAFLKDNNA